MGILVSVIIPVYLVEKHLRKCVDSILNQTYSSLEIILVDDGSPDNCGIICDEYATIDSRVKVIHQKNAGVSAARNTGLRFASGEYIVFIDSDDYVSSQYIEHLMATDADYVAAGCYAQGSDSEWREWPNQAAYITLSDVRRNPELINRIPMGMVWARRYKRRIIQKNSILFDISVVRGEDTLFNSEYLLESETVAVLDASDYFYRFGGAATTSFNSNLFKWSLMSLIKIAQLIGDENDVFYCRAWNNAMLVYENYMQTIDKTRIKTLYQMIGCVFEICANQYTRKSIDYAIINGQKKKAFFVKFYILPLAPIAHKIHAIFRKQRK